MFLCKKCNIDTYTNSHSIFLFLRTYYKYIVSTSTNYHLTYLNHILHVQNKYKQYIHQLFSHNVFFIRRYLDRLGKKCKICTNYQFINLVSYLSVQNVIDLFSNITICKRFSFTFIFSLLSTF